MVFLPDVTCPGKGRELTSHETALSTPKRMFSILFVENMIKNESSIAVAENGYGNFWSDMPNPYETRYAVSALIFSPTRFLVVGHIANFVCCGGRKVNTMGKATD